MQIPQFKPTFDKETIAKALYDYALTDGFYTEFKNTLELERKIAEFLHVKHCILVNNGTLSLSLALLALGIKPDDNVAVPNITMIGTSNAVKLIGANPVFIDVDPNNLCLNLKDFKERVVFGWDNIKAVIYVTLNGRSHGWAEYTSFLDFCERSKIKVLEDNAQSFGSYYNMSEYKINCPSNSIGSFSFSMPKIITTGQGGCLVTDNDELNKKLRKLKDFGRISGGIDIHDDFGINCKFTEPQAIVGLSQIANIEERIKRKKEIFSLYKKNLRGVRDVHFIENNDPAWCPWFVDIFVPCREKLQDFLKLNHIQTRVIYPELTSQKTNYKWFQPKSLRNSKKVAKEGLWLPSSLDLRDEDIKDICRLIREFYA